MLTRTRTTSPDFSESIEKESTIHEIEEKVDERGFYLYEWISPEELRMSIKDDYLSIIQKSSIPLAIVTGIFGFLGFAGGPLSAMIAIMGVLTVFYTIVLAILVVKMIKKSYLYSRGANVVITDNHYISNGKIVKRDDFRGQKEAFENLETIFREPLLEPSGLKAHLEEKKSSLFADLKNIALGGGKVIEKLGRSRDSGGIILVLLLAGVLYGGMMALIYTIGVFFVSILARVFSWAAHRWLLIMDNTEHEIQTLFGKIASSSIDLRVSSKESISLLTEAGRNEWKENLSGKIHDSLALLSEIASLTTKDATALRKLLESSKYRDIFNFTKYGNWVKKQIIEPIDDILLLLGKNRATLISTIASLETQISQTTDPSQRTPLEIQKKRLEIQKESFEQSISLLKSYKEKLL